MPGHTGFSGSTVSFRKAMEIRHGSLLNAYGHAVSHVGFTFVLADVRLDGSSFSSDFRLRDHVGEQAPQILRIPLRQGFDAAWVFARISKAFGVTPEASAVEKSLLWQGFVAVPAQEAVGYPFVCTDHYGRTALLFSDDGPEEALRRCMASAFWELLLQTPEELADFEQRVYHPGAGIWLEYGCKLGHVYCEESPE